MKLRRASLALFVAFTLPFAFAAQDLADAAAQVDRLFQPWDSPETPGVAVAVARGGRTVFAHAYGMAELDNSVPNTTATLFESGSVSKQFTAAAVVLLAQQGKLALTDDVRKHVPELPDYGTPITIRHLLNHTSGLRDWGSLMAIAGWPRETRTHTQDHVLDILRRQRALNYTPGERYSYTNSGYNLLAIIVERVSGTPFAAFSTRHVFAPLGLRDTQWRDDHTRVVKGRSAAYSAVEGGGYAIDRPIENVYGNGGLITTVADLLRWNEALTAGALGGPGFMDEMQRQGVLNDGSTITYASGLIVSTYRGVREISHTGSTSGYRAFLVRYPDQQLSIALLANVGNVNPGRLGRQVADIFLGDAATEPPPSPPAEAAPEPSVPAPAPGELARMAGEYYSPDIETTLRIAVENGGLVAHRRPAARLPLQPIGTDLFRAPSLGRVRFMRDASGAVTELSVQQERVYDLRFERVAR